MDVRVGWLDGGEAVREFRSHWHDASDRTTTDILVRRTKPGSRRQFFARATCGESVVQRYGSTAVEAFNRVRDHLGLSIVPPSYRKFRNL